MANEKLPGDAREEDYEYDTLTNERLIKEDDYDGIRELDNKPPSWFNLLFIGTIVFAFFYLYILFMFEPTGLIQEKEYAQEMEKLKKDQPANERVQRAQLQIDLLTDEASLENGRKIFTSICTACHLADGGGLVGPNLTDSYWVHGNTIDVVYKVVTEGVIEKGMVPYRDQLSSRQRLEVSSFVLKVLVGSQPSNPKEPQGELIPM